MSALRSILSRLRDRLRSRRLDGELRQEIAGHLDESIEDYVRRGLSREAARRAALCDFGGVAATEEAHRDLRSIASLDHLARDLRHALRALGRSPGFTLTVLLVLTVCIAAAASGLTLLNAIVFRPLPYPDADRLVSITHAAPGLQLDQAGMSSGLYFHYREHARSLEALGVHEERLLTLRTDEGAQRVPAAFSSVSFFHTLQVRPILGRLFTDADAAPGFMNMKWRIPILISHGLWVDRFGADPDIAGRIITLSDNPRVIVGVLPAGFAFPSPRTQIWMLTEPPRITANFATDFGWHATARLRPGVSTAAAQGELAALVPAIEGLYRDATPARLAEVQLRPVVTPLQTTVIGGVAAALWPLFGGMILLLLIAGFNVGGLFLVRAEHRQREVALRRALGANTGEVARLFFIEALVLTGAAAGIGLALAAVLLRVVVHRVPLELPRASEISVDVVPIAFASGTAILAAALFALLAVRRQGRRLVPALSAAAAWASGRPRDRRVRHALIAAQVMLALVLLSASALMVRTYRNLTRVELGFAPDRLLTVETSLASRRYQQHTRIFTDLVARLRRLPAVEGASAVSAAPLTANEHLFPVEPQGAPVAFKFFIPGYFETMEIPVTVSRGESVAVPDPVVVSDALARRLHPGGRALGQPIRRLNEDGTVVELGAGPVPPFTIAGIAGAVRETSLRTDPTEIVYIPIVEPAVERSIVPLDMVLVIRTRVPPLDVAASVRREVQAASPDLSVGGVRTMAAIVGEARGPEAFVGALLLAAAVVSAVLGIVGIYGSVAHAARHRAREIGIRVALGARVSEVVRTVAVGTLRATVTGVALGLGATLVATRALTSLLFGVDPADPLTLATMSVALLTAAAGAALLAAWRGARADPLVALRSD